MTVLIDLYDRNDPVNNMIALYALQPERVYYIGESGVLRASRRQMTLKRAAAAMSPNTSVEFILVNPFQRNHVVNAIQTICGQYGASSLVLDLTGGQDILLFQAGSICQQMGIEAVTYRPGKNALLYVYGEKQNQLRRILQVPTVQQMFFAAGCAWLRNGRTLSEDTLMAAQPFAETMLKLLLANPEKWYASVSYFQKALSSAVNKQHVTAPTRIQVGDTVLICPTDILLRLRDIHLISHLGINQRICDFQLEFNNLSTLLADYGVWLEIAVYTRLQKCSFFNQIMINAVVSWDNDDNPDNNVENEIDVIAIRGMGQLFVSCKIGLPEVSALNELSVLVRRFGSRYACGMLVTARDVARNAKLRLRAEQLGIQLLDRSCLSESVFMKYLQTIAARWGGLPPE